VARAVLYSVEKHWSPSEKSAPLLYHIVTKDIWHRSLPGLVPVFGNFYIIYQDVCSYLEQRKNKSLAVKQSIVDGKITGTVPNFCDYVYRTQELVERGKCGDYAVFLRHGEELSISVRLDTEKQSNYVDSVRFQSVYISGKEYFFIFSRASFSSFVDEVYSCPLFPNKDRIVSHITDETRIKIMSREELPLCKTGDLLVYDWPTHINPDGVVYLTTSKEDVEPIKIDKVRNMLQNGTVKGPAVEKFIEIWQRKIGLVHELGEKMGH